VSEYYRAADICVVTSLHDGMNLVAKEYIANRDDEEGTLLLSIFASAARELPEALLINPYDIEECAETFRRAIQMPKEERHRRIRAMREHIKQWNIYRWAEQMMTDAAEVREKKRLHEVIGHNVNAVNNG
jgi:trehalose 6-phosphate synthase